MFKHLFKNQNNKGRILRRCSGQNTAEYAMLIALVIAGVIAMQTYAQRSLQGRVRDAGIFLTQGTNTIGNSVQYEPYYVNSSYDITRDSDESKVLGEGIAGSKAKTNRTRSGAQSSEYNTTVVADTNHRINNPMPSGI